MNQSRNWPTLLNNLINSNDLSISEAAWAMEQILSGEVSDAQLAAFLVALRAKGETVQEIVGFRDSVLEAAVPLEVDSMALDIVGTGGDMVGTFNVSSTAAIVCRGAGIPVIKHGNRAASSKSGSSDVLNALGVDLELSPEQILEVYRQAGITFVFASKFHLGFRHVGGVRKELGIPTIFNFLGPLSNPARPQANAIGVADRDRAPLLAGVFQTRGAAALVFRGDDGLDELTVTGHSHIWEVCGGAIKEHDFDPRDLDIPYASMEDLLGGTAEENAAKAREILSGKEQGPLRDIVLLNAAAGITAYGLATNPETMKQNFIDRMKENYATAAEAIDSGKAEQALNDWATATQQI